MPKPKPIQITIPNPCRQSWDEMTPQGQGRHCAHCQKIVTDFSKWSDTALYEFISKNKGVKVCGRFSAEQVNRDIIPHQPHSRLYKLFIALGLTLIMLPMPADNVFSKPLIEQCQFTDLGDGDKADNDSMVVKGVVYESGKLLAGAIITVSIGDTVYGGCATNTDGFFNMAISSHPIDFMKLTVSYPSYDKEVVWLKNYDLSRNIEVRLQQPIIKGDMVIIIPQYKVPLIDSFNAGTNTTITSDQIEKMPR